MKIAQTLVTGTDGKVTWFVTVEVNEDQYDRFSRCIGKKCELDINFDEEYR